MSTWRSKLCAFLSLVSPLFTQASLCWISGHPGTHLSLSLSLSTGFLGFIPDVFNLDLCPPGDSAFPPFSLLFPFPYLCKWCAWALPLVFSCRLSSSWVYSSYLFLSLQNCLTTFQIHLIYVIIYVCCHPDCPCCHFTMPVYFVTLTSIASSSWKQDPS